MDSAQTSPDIAQLLGVVRRRALLILLCVVIVAGATYAFSMHEAKKYVATASLVFNDNTLSQNLAGLQPVTSSQTQQAQENTEVKLIELGGTATRTAQLLGHGISPEEVSANLAVTAVTESNFVDVSVTSTSPVLAASIANAYTHVFVKEQNRSNRQSYRVALAVVHKELAALPPHQRYSVQGIALQEHAESLAALAEQPGAVQVAQTATVPTVPSSPKTSRNTALGAVLGLLLGLGIAFLLEQLDRRMREPRDLEAAYGLPLLGVVPESSALSAAAKNAGGVALPASESEAFQLIRAHLRYFNFDRELRTLLIASAATDDGKTTVARHLAAAAARVGSRVLLVESDMRRPALAQQLGISSGPGIADVLIGSVSLQEAIQSVDLQPPIAGESPQHAFDMLVAGTLPPNPGELIESHAMQSLLEQVQSTYDLVVIDTPPLSGVSDAFPLLSKVNGVIIVGRVGHTRRDVAERLRATLAETHAPLLGVVANGVKARTLASDAYKYNVKKSSKAGGGADDSDSVPRAQRGVSAAK
jgi:succinoglycan biosynthesis transport protein ExoP